MRESSREIRGLPAAFRVSFTSSPTFSLSTPLPALSPFHHCLTMFTCLHLKPSKPFQIPLQKLSSSSPSRTSCKGIVPALTSPLSFLPFTPPLQAPFLSFTEVLSEPHCCVCCWMQREVRSSLLISEQLFTAPSLVKCPFSWASKAFPCLLCL